MRDNIKTMDVNDRSDRMKVGIDWLTGEACAMSMRILCELTPAAMRRYLQYTGIQADINTIPKSSWNDRDKYAVFLTGQAMHDLMVMYLLESNEVVYDIEAGHKRYLYAGDREELQAYFKKYKNLYGWIDENGEFHKGECYDKGRSYSSGQNPRRGFSNIHAISGNSQ